LLHAEDKVSATDEVLDRHMKTFGAPDMAGILADYAADAVMFTPGTRDQ
jgi:hypothetical protein